MSTKYPRINWHAAPWQNTWELDSRRPHHPQGAQRPDGRSAKNAKNRQTPPSPPHHCCELECQQTHDLRVALDPPVSISVSFCTEKELPAADSQMNCSSSLFKLTTRTLSETRKAKEKPTPNCPTMEVSPPARMASKDALEPDLAIVPKSSRARSSTDQCQNPQS